LSDPDRALVASGASLPIGASGVGDLHSTSGGVAEARHGDALEERVSELVFETATLKERVEALERMLSQERLSTRGSAPR
jgi:hypothetical protein